MVTGIALARGYHDEVVAPLLAVRWPGLEYAAGRLGSGSDVLGLDDETSRDHDWGLRLTLLVEERLVEHVRNHLECHLPRTWRGLPTRFAVTWDATVAQRVEVETAAAFVASRLGVDAARGLSVPDWLAVTGQSVLEVTAGPVFVDSLGDITLLRRSLTWYPDSVWRYVVASDWIRLGRDLPLMGRAGARGDELGHRVLAARVVHTAMHLAFLLARRWPPYPKWLGTLLDRLPVAVALTPALNAVLGDGSWEERQRSLERAFQVLLQAQERAGLPTPRGAPTEPFFDRPFLQIRADVVDLLLDSIDDPSVRALPRGVGSVDEWVDNAQVLTDPSLRSRLVGLWQIPVARHER